MKKLFFLCSLCGTQIPHYDRPSHGLAGAIRYGQTWPMLDDKEPLDICPSCCQVLAKARVLGIISFDDTLLHLQAGFMRKGNLWERTSESTNRKLDVGVANEKRQT